MAQAQGPTKAFGNSPRSLVKPGKPMQEELDPEIAAAAAAFAEQEADPEIMAAAAQYNEAPVAEEPSMLEDLSPEKPSMAGQALDTGIRALDYGGGAVRTLGFDLASKAMGKPVVTDADAKAAMKGKAPESAEYLRRMGVPEGGNLGGITARGAAGFAIDIATDPLTIIGKLAKGSPYLKKLMNGPGMAAEALGEAAYKSAVAGVDAKLAKKGAGSLGDVLVEGGAPVLTRSGIEKKVADMSSVMGKLRQGLYDKATQLGVTIDTGFPLKKAESVLAEWAKDPGMRPAVDELQSMLTRYKEAGKVSIEQMSQWKTNLYNALPASAFDAHGKLKGPAKQFKGALAADFRDAIVGAGNHAEKGLGTAINSLNDRWGTLLEAQSQLAKGVPPSGGLGKVIDGAILATGGLKGLIAKKSYDVATSPYARMIVGQKLMQAGRSGLATSLTNRAIIDSQRPPRTMPDEEEE